MEEENYNLKEPLDEDLIKLIKINNDKDSPIAMSALGKLYERYSKHLMILCERTTMNTSYADEVFQETWRRVYKYASYTSKSGKFFTWLSKIAKNVYLSIREKQLDIVNIEKFDYNNISEKEEADTALPSLDQKLVEEAINKLSPQSKDVLLTYMQYAPSRNDHLPKDQIEILKNKYNTTSVNLRKIKSRAVQSIKDYIEQHR